MEKRILKHPQKTAVNDLTLHLHLTISQSGRVFIFAIYFSAFLIEKYLWDFHFNTLLVRGPFLVLALPFMFIEYWPRFFEKYVALIWKGLITLALPFSFTAILLFEIALTPIGSAWNHNALTEYVLAMFILIQLFNSSKEALTIWLLGTTLALVSVIAFGAGPRIPFQDIGTALLPYALTVAVMGTALRSATQHFYFQRELGAWRSTNAIAHQLRTPLLTIANLASAIRKKGQDSSSEDTNRLAEKISTEIRYTNNVIDHLVANTRGVNANDIELQNLSIKAIVDHAVSTFPYGNPTEEEQVSVDMKDFGVLGSEQLLIHVIYNLISNAIEHSKKRACKIVISSSTNDVRFNTLTVRDEGRGIDPKYSRFVFQPFFTTNSETGTGIGLSFCRDVMSALNGSIDFTSEPGQFSEFNLRFPKN